MKRGTYFIFTIIIILIIHISCLRLKIQLPEEPEITTDYISIVKDINTKKDFSKPIKDEQVNSKDKFIYSIVKVRNVNERIDIKWLWYNPGNYLVKTSEKMRVNEKKQYLEYFVAWDVLESGLFRKIPGKWRVVLMSDKKILCEKNFTIFKAERDGNR